VLDPATQDTLIAFASSRTVDTLYLQLRREYAEPAALPAVTRLVQAAQANNLTLQWVAGEPSWALPEAHAQALQVLDTVHRLNQQLAARELPPIVSVAYDIEPYLLPTWKQQRAEIEDRYIDLAEQLQAAAHARSLQLWLTLPFWFEKQAGARSLLDRADGIIVMAYRNQVSAIADVAASLIERARLRQRPVVVAVETKCVEPTYTSFCGTSNDAVEQALQALQRRYAPLTHVRGFAVHEYGAWQALAPGH
jgi:hypothetical protein